MDTREQDLTMCPTVCSFWDTVPPHSFSPANVRVGQNNVIFSRHYAKEAPNNSHFLQLIEHIKSCPSHCLPFHLDLW